MSLLQAKADVIWPVVGLDLPVKLSTDSDGAISSESALNLT